MGGATCIFDSIDEFKGASSSEIHVEHDIDVEREKMACVETRSYDLSIHMFYCFSRYQRDVGYVSCLD